MARTSLDLLKGEESLIPKCGKCGLWKRCESPKMEPTGKGRKKILVIGEFPGQSEDDQGKHFVGKAGQHLWDTIESLGHSRSDVWTENAIRCRPHESGRNRTPTPHEVDFCRPNVERTIREKEPNVILLLGSIPIGSFLKNRFPEAMSGGGMGRWTGWQIPCRSPNAWVCPTWHPSYLLRENNEVLQREWERHLKAAFRLKGKPWDVIPDEGREIEIILDPDEAAERIRLNRYCNRITAFDYETNCLKPDSAEAKIICCSLSNGTDTIAYPWHGSAIEATKEFLTSDVPKVGAGSKFETRWGRAKLGVWTRNWHWDIQLAAHAIDNRQGVTGVDFQGFVLLGRGDYWSHMKQFIRARRKGGNEKNRIREAGLENTLRYCAIDSLVEWRIMEKQKQIMGVS